jgi:hypothetical protein
VPTRFCVLVTLMKLPQPAFRDCRRCLPTTVGTPHETALRTNAITGRLLCMKLPHHTCNQYTSLYRFPRTVPWSCGGSVVGRYGPLPLGPLPTTTRRTCLRLLRTLPVRSVSTHIRTGRHGGTPGGREGPRLPAVRPPLDWRDRVCPGTLVIAPVDRPGCTVGRYSTSP